LYSSSLSDKSTHKLKHQISDHLFTTHCYMLCLGLLKYPPLYRG